MPWPVALRLQVRRCLARPWPGHSVQPGQLPLRHGTRSEAQRTEGRLRTHGRPRLTHHCVSPNLGRAAESPNLGRAATCCVGCRPATRRVGIGIASFSALAHSPDIAAGCSTWLFRAASSTPAVQCGAVSGNADSSRARATVCCSLPARLGRSTG